MPTTITTTIKAAKNLIKVKASEEKVEMINNN